jgi:hypothetical protein
MPAPIVITTPQTALALLRRGDVHGVPFSAELAALGSSAFSGDYRQRSRAYEFFLEALVETNRDWIRRFPWLPRLEDSGARYKKDPVWHDIPLVIAAGYSDCKSLVAYRLSDLRQRDGFDGRRRDGTPLVKPIISWKRGPKDKGNHVRMHVQVEFPDGRVEDVCRWPQMRAA